MCSEWSSFAAFLADMGERPAGCFLDRRDPDQNYCLKNCQWAPLAGSKKKYRHKRYTA